MLNNDLNYLIKKGDYFYRKRKFHETVAYYDMALEKKPYDIILQTKKANAFYRMGDIQKANTCFNKLTKQIGAFDMLIDHVNHYQKNIGKNISELQHILKSNYNIPINQKHLKLFLKSIKLHIKDQEEQDKFEQFKRSIPYKKPMWIYDYIEHFINFYGRDYKKYIHRLHKFLKEENHYLTYSELENRIRQIKTKMEKPSWSKQKSIDDMNGLEFEEFLYNLFKRKGYRVTRTKYNDQGADLIIESYGEKTVVQAKRQKGNISNSAIQEAYAAKSYYKAKKALVICTSNFTKPAKALAEKLKVELWDRQRLLLEIGNINY